MRASIWPGRAGVQVEAAWAARHEREGAAVYEMMLDLSGLYVKSSQILASSSFLPQPWVRPPAAAQLCVRPEGVLRERWRQHQSSHGGGALDCRAVLGNRGSDPGFRSWQPMSSEHA